MSPTTHLDLVSIEALIIALKNYAGTLVFISHDVYFIKQLATKVLHIAAGKIDKYDGSYDYYLEKTNAEENTRAASGSWWPALQRAGLDRPAPALIAGLLSHYLQSRGTKTVAMPAARAPSIPLCPSSKTRHSRGATSSSLA